MYVCGNVVLVADRFGGPRILVLVEVARFAATQVHLAVLRGFRVAWEHPKAEPRGKVASVATAAGASVGAEPPHRARTTAAAPVAPIFKKSRRESLCCIFHLQRFSIFNLSQAKLVSQIFTFWIFLSDHLLLQPTLVFG